MDQRTIQIFFALLRSAICGTKLTAEERSNYSAEMLQSLLSLSLKHDLPHVLAHGLKQNDLIPEDRTDIDQYLLEAVYRIEQMEYEYASICAALEKAEIPFLPLKGSVIREYYPEPWMRTSCDIDILVHESDLEKAAEHLVDNLGYTCNEKGGHDISLFSESRLHFELHYLLIGEGMAQSSCEVLNNVWKYSFLRTGKEYWYEMNDEIFYFYHIAHMAKHIETGGCGIRPFIDLYILENVENKDQIKRNELLQQGNLLRFAEVSRLLSRVWFEGADHTEVTKQMEQYILRGGTYGSNENRIIVQQQKKGGRLKYALSKIFVPYDVIKFHYPVLQNHRWLTPFMEICRWFKLIFCGHAKRTLNELKYNQTVSADIAASTKKFLEDIGL